MKKLVLPLLILAILIPVRSAYPNRTISLDDLVGTYKPVGGSLAPWFQIEKSTDGQNVDVYFLSQDLKEKNKILTTSPGRFNGPSWLTAQDLFSMAQDNISSLPIGEVASQAVTTPEGFVLVQSQAYHGPVESFAGSDTINFSQFIHAVGSVMRVQWHSSRFTAASLSQGKVLESNATVYFQKVSAI